MIDTVNVKRKSQSVTNLCPNPETNIDIVTIHEGPPINRPKQSLKSVQIQGQKPISTMVEKPSENLGKNETLITRSCACCVCVNKVDAHTQYEIAIKTFVSTYCEVCTIMPQPTGIEAFYCNPGDGKCFKENVS